MGQNVPAIVGDPSTDELYEGIRRLRQLHEVYSRYNITDITTVLPIIPGNSKTEIEYDDDFEDPDGNIDFADGPDAEGSPTDAAAAGSAAAIIRTGGRSDRRRRLAVVIARPGATRAGAGHGCHTAAPPAAGARWQGANAAACVRAQTPHRTERLLFMMRDFQLSLLSGA